MQPTPPLTPDSADSLPMPALEAEVAIVGGGPAGLMAAELLSAAGYAVHLFDAMPRLGRKFLLAGIGGLNLTHAEPFDSFVSRYGARAVQCRSWLERLRPQDIRDWASGLGIETFVGSSQRVFPTDMKAAPLLRAWLLRLRHPAAGVAVTFHMRQRWTGACLRSGEQWLLAFESAAGLQWVKARAVLFALGGGSWARLGSDGAWTASLQTLGASVLPLQPANCGFEVAVKGRPGWSDYFLQRHAGQPLKNVALRCSDSLGQEFSRKGEFVLSASGIEGSLVYAASALLRDEIARSGSASLLLDLRPDLAPEKVQTLLARPRGGKSLANCLRAWLGLSPAAIALLHELLEREQLNDPVRLAAAIKSLPLTLVAPRPLDEAISSAGGVALESLTPQLMLQASPGLFCAGEMLDWEAPTGGYLLTACLASGKVAGEGVQDYLQQAGVRAAIAPDR